ncbi:hypothetical protein ACFQV2_11050 [Actinokineospora soli]|uniref:DUF202 domain-containing protein n=1 Tax=Actinokineospora soli TaxID=1048753 RepID=A0ABW2TKF6_9PSEU
MRNKDPRVRRDWIWNPRMVLSILLGSLAMIASLVGFRQTEQYWWAGLGVVGFIVVLWTWRAQATGDGDGSKVRMHNGVDRLGFWLSTLVAIAFAFAGTFMFALSAV